VPVPRVGLAHPQRGHQAAVQGPPDGLRRPGHGGALPPLAGLVNLTVPLTTLLGLTQAPGAGRPGTSRASPIPPRVLACAAAGHGATRWQITVTVPDGTALAHGSVPAAPGHHRAPEGRRGAVLAGP
jgi:hypothetical protein